MSPAAFKAKYPSGKMPQRSNNHGKVFVCRRGCNTRTATYTEDFVWEDIYRGVDDLDDLMDLVNTQTKATRKRKKEVVHEYHNLNVGPSLYVTTNSDRDTACWQR